MPLLKLQGDKIMEVEVNTTFIDPGIKARYRFTDYRDEVSIDSNLNMKKTGTYKISYTSNEYHKRVERVVRVVDTTPPQLVLEPIKKQDIRQRIGMMEI